MKSTSWYSSPQLSVGLSSRNGNFRDERSMFVFGLGYTAVELSKLLRADGWRISGTCCNIDKKETLKHSYGFESYILPPRGCLQKDGLEALRESTHLLSCVPPDVDLQADTVLMNHKQDIELAAGEHGKLRWIGYMSSTGVYGDHRGGLVDESSQPKPADAKATARLQAENSWLQLQESGASVQIFRLGGIYGPGRSVLDSVKTDSEVLSTPERLVRDARRFTSRVHVSDICQVIMASIKAPNPGRIYNVVDDDPAPRSEAAAFARALLKIKQQDTGQDPNPQGSSSQQRVAEKRVMNNRIKEELGVQLKYPSYREGLISILQEER